MKKLFFRGALIFLISLFSCNALAFSKDSPWTIFMPAILSANAVETTNEDAKPILTLVEENGARYLIDENGNLYSYLVAPTLRADFATDSIHIYNYIEYGPPIHYDGFKASCGGHPRANPDDVIYFDVEMSLGGADVDPPRGSNYSWCRFQGYIIDGKGETFLTESSSIRYSLP